MRADYVHVAIVLDRSGSMESVRDDTVGGFNHFLAQQKREPGKATLTLAQFDHEYGVVTDFTLLDRVSPLNHETYVPRGSTALLNAIGRTIRDTGKRLADMPEADRPGKVLFVIITDGQENASHEQRDPGLRYTKSQINEMISLQRNQYNWEFVFLGADQDAIAEGAKIGISAASSMMYSNTSHGTQSAFNSVTANTTKLRSATASGVTGQSFSFTEDDRKEAKKTS